jgi:hypothetical protein
MFVKVMVRKRIQMFSLYDFWWIRNAENFISTLSNHAVENGYFVNMYCSVSDLHWFLVSMRPDPVLDDQKFIKKFTAEKKLKFVGQKLQFTYT